MVHISINESSSKSNAVYTLYTPLNNINNKKIFLYNHIIFYMQARHTYICDYHKQVIQCARSKQQQQRRRKDSEEDSGETDNDLPEVDLFQLQVGTLRRYKRHYKVSTRPGLNKAQLADVSIKI